MNKIISLLLLCMTVMFAKDICEDIKVLKNLNKINSFIEGKSLIDVEYPKLRSSNKEYIEEKWYCQNNKIVKVIRADNLSYPYTESLNESKEKLQKINRKILKIFSNDFIYRSCKQMKEFGIQADMLYIFSDHKRTSFGEWGEVLITKKECEEAVR